VLDYLVYYQFVTDAFCVLAGFLQKGLINFSQKYSTGTEKYQAVEKAKQGHYCESNTVV